MPVAALMLLLAAGNATAQQADDDIEARARALAAERLVPLLEALTGSPATTAPDGVRFLVRVGGSVEGLAVGAPVTMRGFRVGTVREVAVTFDTGTGRLDVPVVIDIVPGSLIIDGQRPETPDGLLDAVATLVRRGLRAQLASPSLLASSREVALDLVPDAPPAALGDGTPPEIPSQPTRLEAASATLDRLLVELGKLPVDRLAGEAETILMALRELVTAPELRQAIVDLAGAAGALRTTAGQLAQRADPLIASLTRTAEAAGPVAIETMGAARDVLAGPELRDALANLTALSADLRQLPAQLLARGDPLLASATVATDQAGQAAAEARRTIVALDATFGSRSTFQSDLRALLREITGTTRSLRQLLDLLERQPDVLIRGKRGGPPP